MYIYYWKYILYNYEKKRNHKLSCYQKQIFNYIQRIFLWKVSQVLSLIAVNNLGILWFNVYYSYIITRILSSCIYRIIFSLLIIHYYKPSFKKHKRAHTDLSTRHPTSSTSSTVSFRRDLLHGHNSESTTRMKALKSRRIFKASSCVFLSIFFVHAQKLFIRSTVGLMCSRFLPPSPPYHCSVLFFVIFLFFCFSPSISRIYIKKMSLVQFLSFLFSVFFFF